MSVVIQDEGSGQPGEAKKYSIECICYVSMAGMCSCMGGAAIISHSVSHWPAAHTSPPHPPTSSVIAGKAPERNEPSAEVLVGLVSAGAALKSLRRRLSLGGTAPSLCPRCPHPVGVDPHVRRDHYCRRGRGVLAPLLSAWMRPRGLSTAQRRHNMGSVGCPGATLMRTTTAC